MTNLSLETNRLIIRPTHIKDAAFIYTLMNSLKWIEFIGDRQINSVEKARDYIIERALPQFKQFGYSNFTVLLKTTETKIGTCGLYRREGVEGVDIGFAFLPAYEKKGYAYEAACKIKDFAFSSLGIDQLNAYTTESNVASQKLLEKLNMTAVGFKQLPNDKAKLIWYTVLNA
jgi:ribosomal-protein-alanine N-acetyltransferase